MASDVTFRYDSLHALERGEEAVARADGDRRAGDPLPEREAIVDSLRTVHDPEIPVNIYDLGLIYELDIDAEGAVKLQMTLTTPACPVAGMMPQQVADAVALVPNVGEIEVKLVWDPPWTTERMTEDARLALDMF
jgi:FeS assembly SUF system protein